MTETTTETDSETDSERDTERIDAIEAELHAIKRQLDEWRGRDRHHEPDPTRDRPTNPDPGPTRLSRRGTLGIGALLGSAALLGGGVDRAMAETSITQNPTPATCIWRGPQDATGYSLLNLGLLDLDDRRQGSDEPAGIVNVDGKLYRVVPA